MTDWTNEQRLEIAQRVLQDPRADAQRRRWAQGEIVALATEEQKRAASESCPQCHGPHTLSQCTRWRVPA